MKKNVSTHKFFYIVYQHLNLDTSSSSYEYAHPRERTQPNIYTIDFNQSNRRPPNQIRRSREPPPVIEQAPPSYHHSMSRTRFQPVSLYSSVRTTPASNQIHRSSPSPVISSTMYSAMPPSYAEIFLTPNPLPNG